MRGEVTEAKACAQRYLAIDPYCERMHAALMRLHLTQGERARAASAGELVPVWHMISRSAGRRG